MPIAENDSLKIGSCVELHGLNRAEYNGDRGLIIRGLSKKTGRIQVLHFHKDSIDGKVIRVKPANLKLSNFFAEQGTRSNSRKKKVLVATKRICEGKLVLCEKPIFKTVRREYLDKIGLGMMTQFCDEDFIRVLCALGAYEELDHRTRELISDFSAPQTGSKTFNEMVRARINPLIMDQPEFRLKFDGEKTEYLEFIARMIVNSFPFKGETYYCEVLYQLGSWLSHSCDPNVRYDSTRNKGLGTFYASRDIEPGDIITFSLVTARFPRFMRRELIKLKYYFDCECESCTTGVDYSRALPCPKCLPPNRSSIHGVEVSKGFIFCHQSLVSGGSPWVCSNCKHHFATKDIDLDEEQELRRAKEAWNFEAKHQSITKINLNEAKHFWEKDRSAFGPYHWTTMSREKILCRVIIAGRGNETTPEEIEKHVHSLKQYSNLMSDDLNNELAGVIVRLVDYLVKNVPSMLPLGIRCLRYALRGVPDRPWDEGRRQICARLAKFEETKQKQPGANNENLPVSDEQLKNVMESLTRTLQSNTK